MLSNGSDRRRVLPLLVALQVVALSAASTAQIHVDFFNYTAATVIPNWIEARGDWQATGASMQCEGTQQQQFALHTPSGNLRDCVVECTVDVSSPWMQFAGPVCRAFRPMSGRFGEDLIAAKVQDNDGDGLCDRLYLYQHTPGTFPNGLAAGFFGGQTARVRLHVAGTRIAAHCDYDNDGNWDVGLDMNTSLGVRSAPCGATGWDRARILRWAMYNRVLLHHRQSPPAALGNTLRMVMTGQPNERYAAATCLSNTGIPVGGGRSIPGAFDPLFAWTRGLPSYTGALDFQGAGEL